MSKTPRVDGVAYRQFLSKIRIGQIRLESLNLSRRDDPHGSGTVAVGCQPEAYTLDGEALRVRFLTTVKAESTDAESKPVTVFTLRIRHSVEYTVPVREADDDMLRFFVQNNVIINLWPYVRQLVNDLSFRMGLPPVILGLQMMPSAQERDEGSR